MLSVFFFFPSRFLPLSFLVERGVSIGEETNEARRKGRTKNEGKKEEKRKDSLVVRTKGRRRKNQERRGGYETNRGRERGGDLVCPLMILVERLYDIQLERIDHQTLRVYVSADRDDERRVQPPVSS